MKSKTQTLINLFKRIIVLGCMLTTLSACAPFIFGGVVVGTFLVINDRRTSGTQLEDKNIALKIQYHLSQKLGNTPRINALVYSGVVLLTGEVPNASGQSQATAIAREIDNVKSVVNQLVVGPVSSLNTRSQDLWITSKVRSQLLSNKFVPSGSIAMTTDRGVVYLMGKVTQGESQQAALVASQVGGVIRVVKLFEIIDAETARQSFGTLSTNRAPSSSTAPAVKQAPIHSGYSSENGRPATVKGAAVQALPVQ